MDAFLAKLAGRLAALEHACSPSGFVVAFSGGLDSSVLLEACRRLEHRLPLRAIHVDHGLRPESARWAEHCRKSAAALDVPLEVIAVTVSVEDGQGTEAAAREARYRALGDRLADREMLLTAHHAQDQLETVLLRLLRGTGVKGLRGVLESAPLARGQIGRPLLAFSKAEIVAAARRWKLAWIEDPSNRDSRFDRNYLRSAIVPALARRWPAAERTVSRAAERMVEAEALLGALAEIDATGIDDPGRVPLAALTKLDAARQRNLLRYLLDTGGLPVPSASQLEALVAALAAVRRDAQTCVRWPGAEARVHRDRLYLMPALPARSAREASGHLSPSSPWAGPEGRLALVAAADAHGGAAVPDDWAAAGLTVRFRRGGERFQPSGVAHRRALKKLLQEAGVVPWMRPRVPLLYRDEELVAVGDLWVSAAAAEAAREGGGWRIRWSGHPPLR